MRIGLLWSIKVVNILVWVQLFLLKLYLDTDLKKPKPEIFNQGAKPNLSG